MPARKSYGEGINSFADNFIRTFTLRQQMEEHDKDQEQAYTLEALKLGMTNDDLPLSKRNQFLREYLKVATKGKVKEVPPQMQSLLDSLNELEQEDVKVGSKETKIPSTMNQSIDEAMTSEGSLSSGIPTTITQDIIKKRGSLSPNEYKSIQLELQRQREGQTEEDRTLRIAKKQQELQEQYLIKNGYKEGEILYDPEKKQYYKTFENPLAPEEDRTRKIYYPSGSIPEKVQLAQTRAGMDSPVIRTLAASLLDEVNPDTGRNFTQEEAFAKARDMYRIGFNQNQEGKNVQITKGQQDITGTSPDDKRADEVRAAQERRDAQQVLTDFELAEGNRDDAQKRAEGFDVQIRNASNRIVEIDRQITDIQKRYEDDAEEYQKDKDYQTLVNEKHDLASKIADWQTKKDDAFSEKAKQQRLMDSAVGRSSAFPLLRVDDKARIVWANNDNATMEEGLKVGSAYFNKDGTYKSGNDKAKKLIDVFRKKNPDVKSDIEAYHVLADHGKLKGIE